MLKWLLFILLSVTPWHKDIAQNIDSLSQDTTQGSSELVLADTLQPQELMVVDQSGEENISTIEKEEKIFWIVILITMISLTGTIYLIVKFIGKQMMTNKELQKPKKSV